MAGTRVLIQRRLNFTCPTIQASGTLMVPLLIGLNTLGWVSGVLEVVVYKKDLSANLSAQVNVANVVTVSDGQVAAENGSLASVQIPTGQDDELRLITADFTPPIASSVGVILLFETTNAGTGSGDLGIEVYLVGRDA
jgi:hypothetical protein